MSSGSQPHLMGVMLVFMLLGGLWAGGYFDAPGTASTALSLSAVLQTLPVLNANTLGSINGAPEATNINTAINDINSKLGMNFGLNEE